MIAGNCSLGRKTLPVLPCDYISCPWYVHHEDYANCFWVVAEVMFLLSGGGFTVKDIAKFENITEEEVEELLRSALKKIRVNFRGSLLEFG